MAELTRVIPAGTTVNLTSGEYSDFGLEATGVALKDCDVIAAVREWREALGSYAFAATSDFISWLFSAGGYFKHAPVATWHVGAYRVGESMSYEEATGE